MKVNGLGMAGCDAENNINAIALRRRRWDYDRK